MDRVTDVKSDQSLGKGIMVEVNINGIEGVNAEVVDTPVMLQEGHRLAVSDGNESIHIEDCDLQSASNDEYCLLADSEQFYLSEDGLEGGGEREPWGGHCWKPGEQQVPTPEWCWEKVMLCAEVIKRGYPNAWGVRIPVYSGWNIELLEVIIT